MAKRIYEIMNTKLETISPDATVYEAIEKLIDKRIRPLFVQPKDEKRRIRGCYSKKYSF